MTSCEEAESRRGEGPVAGPAMGASGQRVGFKWASGCCRGAGVKGEGRPSPSPAVPSPGLHSAYKSCSPALPFWTAARAWSFGLGCKWEKGPRDGARGWRRWAVGSRRCSLLKSADTLWFEGGEPEHLFPRAHSRREAARSKRKGETAAWHVLPVNTRALGPLSAAGIWPFPLLSLRSAKKEVAESGLRLSRGLSAAVSFPTPGLRLC